MLVEIITCTTISPHLYIPSDIKVHRYPPLRQLQSDFRDFNNGVCHVMKITVAESNSIGGTFQASARLQDSDFFQKAIIKKKKLRFILRMHPFRIQNLTQSHLLWPQHCG